MDKRRERKSEREIDREKKGRLSARKRERQSMLRALTALVHFT